MGNIRIGIFVDGECCSGVWRKEMDDAVSWAGHPIPFSGVVGRGRELGRKLGFPTANLPVPADKIALARERLESGYYLSDEVALATAARMLQADAAPPPP